MMDGGWGSDVDDCQRGGGVSWFTWRRNAFVFIFGGGRKTHTMTGDAGLPNENDWLVAEALWVSLHHTSCMSSLQSVWYGKVYGMVWYGTTMRYGWYH
jgi:hypothetical protein